MGQLLGADVEALIALGQRMKAAADQFRGGPGVDMVTLGFGLATSPNSAATWNEGADAVFGVAEQAVMTLGPDRVAVVRAVQAGYGIGVSCDPHLTHQIVDGIGTAAIRVGSGAVALGNAELYGVEAMGKVELHGAEEVGGAVVSGVEAVGHTISGGYHKIRSFF